MARFERRSGDGGRVAAIGLDMQVLALWENIFCRWLEGACLLHGATGLGTV
jgi:hypothetical protein